MLLTINNAIIANLDSSSLFAAVAEVVGGVLPFDLATFLLLDSRREELIVRGLAGVAEPSDGLRVGSSFRLQESHLAPLFNGERTLLLPSLREHGAMADEMRLHRAGLRSVIAVPLERDITIGAFCLGSSKEEAFQPRDAEFLAELGQQIALAVGNMLAYEEIARLKSRLEQENVYLREEIQTEHNFDEIVGASPALKSALKAVETVAPTEATVLVTGETGTGKELIARAIHQLSPRESRPLVKVNCATIPSGLVESELFGHEKGAFTGAMNRKIGRFELADRGTIFLDEVGDLPADLQAKLLRVLQEGEFERVGGSRTFKVNTRVIAATNRDLGSAMEEGQFRPDLYYRLNVFPIHLAPLRERAGDVALLAQHFVQKHSSRMGKRVEILPRKALDALAEYSWPGNVRELENVVERAIITSSGPELELGSWLDRPRRSAVGAAGAGERDASATLDELQRGHIADVLERVGWRVSGERGGARILGLKPTTLEARMKKLGIRRPGA